MKIYRWNYRWLIAGFILKVIAFTALTGLLFMWLWNGLITNWTGLESITYLQSIGLLVLFKILTGFPRKSHLGHRHYAWKMAYIRPQKKSEDYPIS